MHRLKVPAALAVYLGAIAAAFSGRWPWQRLHVAPAITVSSAWVEFADTLRWGESLGTLLERHRITRLDPRRLVAAGFDARQLRAGLVFNFRRLPSESEPYDIEVRTGPEERFRMWRHAGGWGVSREEVKWDVENVVVRGLVGSSLYEGLDESVPDSLFPAQERMRLAWDLADVYAWSTDFSRDLQTGDRFVAVVERKISPEGEVRYGRVLASTLEVSGNAMTAIRFWYNDRESFYDANGASLRRAFLAAPVEFRRISSTFSRARLHPILRRYRAHTGIDYSAVSGTPVMAAGDGRVLSAGWAGGYGIVVEIQHRNDVTTRYAHLRGLARGIRKGVRVKQGQPIGYVGSTGLSTAPHLHYEFRVNGAPKDPRRVQMPAGPPIIGESLAEFQQVRDGYSRMLVLPSPREIRNAD